MKQLPYLIVVTALATSATAFAAGPVPSIPAPPNATPAQPTPTAPPTPTTPALPTQPPLDAAQSVNCPDVAQSALPAPGTTAATVDKPPSLNTASVLGPKPKMKPDAATAEKVAGAIPATKPYASTINPTAGTPDPCAKTDPLKALKPNN